MKLFLDKYKPSKSLSILLFLAFLILLAKSLGISIVNIDIYRINFQLLFYDLAFSFIRVTGVALFVLVLSTFFGYFIHSSKSVKNLSDPLIQFLRHISPFAWLPFAIIWFGIGELSIAFVMAVTLFFPMLISIINVFNSIPKKFIYEAMVCGASSLQIVLNIKFPLAFAGILETFRSCWAIGWATIIAAEMLGVNSGLGFRMLDFRYLLDYKNMLIYFIVMGVVGILLDFFMHMFIKKALPGRA